MKNNFLAQKRTTTTPLPVVVPTTSTTTTMQETLTQIQQLLQQFLPQLQQEDNMMVDNNDTPPPPPCLPSPASSHLELNSSSSTNSTGAIRAHSALGLVPPSVPTAEEIVTNMLTQEQPQPFQSLTEKSRPRFLNMNYDHHLQKSVISVIQEMWADSTRSNRRSLWTRFESFCKARSLRLVEQMDFAIPMFCEHCKKVNKHIKPSSRYQYSKDLAAIAGRLSVLDLRTTRMYQRGLQALGACIPQDQAPAVTHDHMKEIVQHALNYRQQFMRKTLYTVIYMMYKTASRYDEVHNLCSSQVTVINNKEIVIDWSNRTKSTRTRNQFRADNAINVYGENSHPQIVLETLNDLPHRTTLCNWTTTRFDKWLKTLPQPLPKYSAHSFKAFAVTILAQMAVHKLIPPYMVVVMAKRKIDHPDLLPATTNRYFRSLGPYSSVQLRAELNNTRVPTNLLKWMEDPLISAQEQQVMEDSPVYQEEEQPDEQQEEYDLLLQITEHGMTTTVPDNNNNENQMMMMMQ